MDWFGVIWLAVVAFVAYWNWAWFWRGHKTGTATIYFQYAFKREEKPFEFRMIQIGRVAGFLMALALFVFGLRFVHGI